MKLRITLEFKGLTRSVPRYSSGEAVGLEKIRGTAAGVTII